MNAMDYKDYVTVPRHNSKEHCYEGRILGIKEDVTYQAHHAREVRKAFEAAVDKYIADCEKAGKAPENPYAESITLQVSQPLAKGLLVEAAESDMTIEQFIIDTLRRHLVEDLNTWDY